MKKISPKVRTGIAVGLFIWAILAILFTIIFSFYHFQLWVAIVIPILAFVAFIFSVIIMPKSEINNSALKKKKAPINKQPTYKQKKPFISEDEWNELEEEEDEISAMEEVDED